MAKKKKVKATKATMTDLLDSIDPAFLNNRVPKNPKGSARAKFNRRCKWAASTLRDLRMAAEAVLAQKGTVYKRAQVATVLEGITQFEKITGITYKDPVLSPERMKHLEDALLNGKPYVSPPAAQTIAFHERWGFHVSDDLRQRAKKEATSTKKIIARKKR